MKKILIFPNTIWRPFLVALPLAFLLTVSIRMNPEVDTPGKLYPLIIFSAAAIIFTFLFYFRPVILSRDEIKSIGPFSSRDKAVINKDKTLILTERDRGMLSIDLYGNDGTNADLDWLKNEDVAHDTYLFKSKVLGGISTMKNVLFFFGADEKSANRLLSADEAEMELYGMIVTVTTTDQKKEMRIKFTKTL